MSVIRCLKANENGIISRVKKSRNLAKVLNREITVQTNGPNIGNSSKKKNNDQQKHVVVVILKMLDIYIMDGETDSTSPTFWKTITEFTTSETTARRTQIRKRIACERRFLTDPSGVL
jgi:hypothetical protein